MTGRQIDPAYLLYVVNFGSFSVAARDVLHRPNVVVRDIFFACLWSLCDQRSLQKLRNGEVYFRLQVDITKSSALVDWCARIF